MASFSLHGGVVAITGATGNLGRHFTVATLAAGARVALLDVAAPAPGLLARLAAEAGVDEDQMHYVACDVSDHTSVQAAHGQIMDRFGLPTGLINCAAIDAPPTVADSATFETFPPDRFEAMIDVNLHGVVRCCQIIGGAMAAAGRGSIVNVASHYALVAPDPRIYQPVAESGQPFVKPAAYIASKAGVLGLTRYLAAYWGATGVRVNALTPGGVFADQDPAFVREYEARVPLGRMARADEYNGAIVFLLSDASSYMTGSNIVVDGGVTAW